jgi:tRNA threonylcarbamoyladenosine biosynthesis protein TsaB
MQKDETVAGNLYLAIDTCGVTGTVALGCWAHGELRVLGQTELEGRSVSSTLIGAVGTLLAQAGIQLRVLSGMVVVSGPGSFTGVRVGLSAVKGLAEAAALPLVAVSRLETMAVDGCAALDAHRHEVFLRLPAAEPRELLAGVAELARIDPPPVRIAVCDDAAAALLGEVWPLCQLLRVSPPAAAAALALGVPRLEAGERADVARLDGHYLRRSDAEIFGAPPAPASDSASQGPSRG